MTGAAFAFVWAFRFAVPLWDEWWGIVPALSGHEPDMLRWLWRLHNSHRFVIPKGVLWLIDVMADYDFRTAAFFGIAAIPVLAAAMILTAKRIRGYTSYLDAFFPLFLL